jgi:nucleoside-diphosphate-sugar epimerase
VLLSGRGEEEAQATEEALLALGADLTIVRASWFMQNFSEGAFLDDILAGELALPVGAVREPFIDAEDIADVAVAALTDDRHIGQTYELTGPRLLTFADAVGEIGIVADVDCAHAFQRRRPRGSVIPIEIRRSGPRADAHGQPTRRQLLGDSPAGLAGAAQNENWLFVDSRHFSFSL